MSRGGNSVSNLRISDKPSSPAKRASCGLKITHRRRQAVTLSGRDIGRVSRRQCQTAARSARAPADRPAQTQSADRPHVQPHSHARSLKPLHSDHSQTPRPRAVLCDRDSDTATTRAQIQDAPTGLLVPHQADRPFDQDLRLGPGNQNLRRYPKRQREELLRPCDVSNWPPLDCFAHVRGIDPGSALPARARTGWNRCSRSQFIAWPAGSHCTSAAIRRPAVPDNHESSPAAGRPSMVLARCGGWHAAIISSGLTGC
jgi:hypothetical protein